MRLLNSLCGIVVLAAFLWFADSVSARQWKPSALTAAQEYLQIDHSLSDQEGVIVIWLAPEFFANTAEERVVRDMTREYLFVALIHFSISDFGEWSFETPSDLKVELANAAMLTPLPQESLPPLVTSVTRAIGDVMAAGLGKMGEGINLFLFDGTRVDRCEDGAIWVNYLKERYEYQTPLPGCPPHQEGG